MTSLKWRKNTALLGDDDVTKSDDAFVANDVKKQQETFFDFEDFENKFSAAAFPVNWCVPND